MYNKNRIEENVYIEVYPLDETTRIVHRKNGRESIIDTKNETLYKLINTHFVINGKITEIMGIVFISNTTEISIEGEIKIDNTKIPCIHKIYCDHITKDFKIHKIIEKIRNTTLKIIEQEI